jgi:hypothetical protein
MNIIVTLTEDERAVLDSWLGVGQITAWVQHALNNKVRRRTDASILEVTDRNPKKMSMAAKLALLKKYKLPTRKERGGSISG